MKKRNAKVFALFMSVAMAMPNVAAAMPVYAAPEADFGDKFEEEFEAEAEEEVEAEDTTDADDEFVEETEDVEVVTISRGECGTVSNENEKITWELESDGTLAIHATGAGQYMKDYSEANPAPWYDIREGIKSVEVSGDIRNIGEYAFYDCKELKTVELSYTIRLIDEFAFAECASLEKVTYDEPAKVCVERYGRASFMNCTSLKQMDISQRVRYIDDFTFYNCVKFVPSNMETLPNTLTWIGEGAFWNCQSITKVVIPYSVEYIGGGYCGKNYTPTWGVKVYGSSDEATNVDGITDKWGAFAGCTGLTSVQFVNYLVEDDTTADGVRLAGVTYIDDFAFYGCTSLGSVTLPATLEYLGDFAFADCTGMTEATIEDSELERLYGTFEECTSLTKVVFGTNETREYDKDQDGVPELYTGYWSGIREIGKRSFNACSSLTDVVLTPELFNWRYELGIHKNLAETANDMTVIGEDAFRGCSKLAHFDFPADTLKIGSSAFRDDSLLNHVVLAETTTELGANAFYNDVAMEDFYIPRAMGKIGADCFNSRQGIQAMRLMDLYYGGDDFDFGWINIAQSGNDLITSGSNAMYKATRYNDTNPTYPVSTNVDVVYEKSADDETSGIMQISWEPVTRTIIDKNGVERVVNPTKYFVYQNNIGSNTVDDQWKTVTPSWTWIGSPTTNSLPWSVDNVKPGDIYNYRVMAYFGDEHGYLTAYKEYVVSSAADEVKITDMEFAEENQEVKVESTIDVALKILPEGASTKDISWVSSDAKVASVAASGDKATAQVTGIATGTATITASTTDGVVATCTITVVPKNYVSVSEIKFNETALTVGVKGTGDLSVTVSPEDYGSTNFIWESSNNQIATVAPTGDKTTATVTGVKEGTATITVTSANGTTASIDIKVEGQATADTGTRLINGVVYVNGVAQENYTGLAMNGAGEKAPWVYVENGKQNTEFEGYVDFDGAKFYVKDGVLDTKANGVKADWSQDPVVFYFCSNGQVQTQHVGLAEYDGEWFYIQDGKVQTDMNKFVEYDGGLFAVAAGRIVSEYSGLMQDPTNAQTGAWYFFANGQAQTQYTGLAQYDGHWFYVQGGKFDPAYNGTVVYDGATFEVVNGEAQVK
ncbi:MAG: leucine-rich repeat protein [Lachnospiraceae bacterium]|nr:leucine-rich repeat protein [Lachnospiraceae bacterium]